MIEARMQPTAPAFPGSVCTRRPIPSARSSPRTVDPLLGELRLQAGRRPGIRAIALARTHPLPAHPRRPPAPPPSSAHTRSDPLPSSSEREEMNTSTLLGVEFRPITIPESIDSPDAADFLEMVASAIASTARSAATTTTPSPPDELLPLYQPDELRASLPVAGRPSTAARSAASASNFPSRTARRSRSG